MNSHRLYVDKELGLSKGAHIPVPSTHKAVTSVAKELYRCNNGSDTELRTWSWPLMGGVQWNHKCLPELGAHEA